MISNHLSQSRVSSDDEEQQKRDENGNMYNVKEEDQKQRAEDAAPPRGFSRFSPTMRSI